MGAFRNTIQKDMVLRTLNREKKHLTAEQILAVIQEENPVISRSTVFRILNQLSERGDILRVRVPNGADCFDFNTTPHYHVKCIHCGKVADVDMPYMDDIGDQIHDTHGYLILDHTISFSGICPNCREKRSI